MTGFAAHAEGAVRPRRPFVSREVSPTLFVAILVAFRAPVRNGPVQGCGGVHGLWLATWRVQQTSPVAKTDDGESLPTVIEREASPMALLMLVSTVAGLVLGLAGRCGAGFAVTVGLFGSAVLWSRVFDMNSGAVEESGFQLASASLVVLAFWHAALGIRRIRLAPPRGGTVLPPGAVPLGRLEDRGVD